MRYWQGLVDEQLWKRGVWHWAAVSGICLLLFAFDAVGFFEWGRIVLERGVFFSQRPILAVKQWVGKPFTLLASNQALLIRMAGLEERLAQSAVDAVRLHEVETRLADLEAMNQVLPVDVKARQLAQLFVVQDKVMVGAGEVAGVGANQLVTDKHGILVGKVKAVGAYVSRLQTPKDNGFRMAVQTSEGTAKGVVESNGSKVLLTGVLQTEPMEIGDIIVTSGKDETAPPNVVVGQVVRLLGNPADPTKGAEIELLASYEGWAALW